MIIIRVSQIYKLIKGDKKMLFKVLKHFKSDIKIIGMFAFGIGIGIQLDSSYTKPAFLIAFIALTIDLIIGFINLQENNKS